MEEKERRQEWFERTLRTKEAVLKDPTVMRNIKNVLDFCNGRYEGTVVNDQERPTPQGTLLLGSGSVHNVYGVGNIPHPEIENNTLHLALRVGREKAMYQWIELEDLVTNRFFSRELGLFEEAFVNPKALRRYEMSLALRKITRGSIISEPPHFVAAVKYGKRGGILTEDASLGRSADLNEETKELYSRIDKKKKPKVFFLDPNSFIEKDGSRYLEEKARIEIT